MSVNPDLLAADMAAIKKRRKGAGGRMGDEVVEVERIPLESPTMMRITTGGIPIGRVSRFYGSYSGGKSHMAYLVIRAAQRLKTKRFPKGMQCALWNAEGVYQASHVARLGVDVKKLYVDDTQVIEEIAEGIGTMLRSTHLHVIDSTSDAKSYEELNRDLVDGDLGIQSKAWKRAMKHMKEFFDNDENVILLISHAGTKIDIQRRTSYSYPKDGEHLQFASSLNVEFDGGAWLYYHPDGHLVKAEKIKEDVGLSPSGRKEPDGFEVTVTCKKNRVGRQHLTGKMRFDLNTFAFDTTFELLDGGKFFDEDGNPAHRSGKPAIIRPASGSWYELPDGRKANGEPGIRAEIDTNPELAGMIRRAMLAGH